MNNISDTFDEPYHPAYPKRARDSHEYLDYDPSAPRIEIAGDLPIDVVSLIDLLAFYVAKSGPTVEEEIIRREEGNPQFRFITDGARGSAQNAYYRWRLYSLLQGDSMTLWRQTPFTMERWAGAYVWVPPPPINAGPASLYAAYRTLLSPPVPASYPPPSAYWLSRQLTGEGKAFGTLSSTDAEAWTRMLDTQAVLRGSVAAESTASPPSEAAFDEAVRAASATLLAADAIAERMVFAVEKSQPGPGGGGAAPHLLSILLDAMVRIAYDAAAEAAMAPTDADPALPHTRQALRCVAQLAHLFLLHDTLQNSRAVPLLTEEELDAAEAQRGLEEERARGRRELAALASGRGLPPSPLTPPTPGSAATAGAPPTARADGRAASALYAATSAVLPTALEAVTLTALAAGLAGVRAEVAEGESGFSLGTGGAAGLASGPRHVVSISVPAASTQRGGSGSGNGAAEKAAVVGQHLLAWVSQLLCLWSNREYRGSAAVPTAAERGAEREPRAKLVTLRGSFIVQTMDRYEWLLPSRV